MNKLEVEAMHDFINCYLGIIENELIHVIQGKIIKNKNIKIFYIKVNFSDYPNAPHHRIIFENPYL